MHDKLTELLDLEYENMKKSLLSKKYDENSFDIFFMCLRKLDYSILNKFKGSEIKPFL